MKKISVLLCLLLISYYYSNAQTQLTCATEERDTTEFEQLPWFGNNQYLENFLDSIGYPQPNIQNRIVDQNIKFWIPVKFWIYRNSNGTGGPTERQIRDLMDALNRFYNQDNNTWLAFYLKCDPTYINDDQHTIVTHAGATLLANSHNDQGAVNVHIVEDFHFGALGIFYPSPLTPNSIFIQRDAYEGNWMSTLPHEVGHFFNLDHTHQYSTRGKCRREPISRTRTWPTIHFCFFGGGGTSSARICESTGDGLADTPGDPNLISNSSCDYTLGGTDLYGDSYTTPPTGARQPDTRNTMSYNGDDNCINFFSRQQIAVMLHSIHRGRHREKRDYWQHRDGIFDDYEPNNNSVYARPIVFGEIQEHSFHRQYNGNGNNWASCDVDWVRFIAPCSGNFEVFTSAILSRTNANTRLTLYDNNLVQLAQNDDISANDKFSSIQFNFIAGSEYFIRVENMSSLVTGYYNLQVGRFTMQGTSSLCSPTTFTLQNLPTGASITWTASPGGIVSFNPVGPTTNTSTTVSRIANGNVTVTATVVACGVQFSIGRGVNVGAPATPGPISWTWNAPPNRVLLDVDDVPGATSYRWYLDGVLKATTTSSTYQLPMNGNVSCGNFYYFGVRAVNSCGASLESYVGATMPPCGFAYTVSPNPSSDNIRIESNDEAAKLNNKKPAEIHEIELYDKMGIIRQKQKFVKGQTTATISVAALPNDVYTLRIFDGQEWQSCRIVVQH